MKKTIKRIMASLLAAVMIITVAPLNGFVGLKLNLDWLNFDWLDVTTKSSALSSSGSCGTNVTYTFDESTGLLTISGSGSMSDYSYNGSPFYNDSSIKTVVIVNGVTSIGNSAFENCTGLTSITIGNSVTSISRCAFKDCSDLTNITIPDSVNNIGYYVFDECGSLKNAFYSGTQDEWDEITIDSGNSWLTECNIHFGVSAEESATHCHYQVIEDVACGNDGRVSVTCDCGYSYEEYIPALGHIKASLVETVSPTCTDYGYTVYHCDRCNYDYYDDYISALGHNIENGKCTRCEMEQTILDINLNNVKKVDIKNPGDEYLFRFSPVESGKYWFYSDSVYLSPYGELYDSEMNFIDSSGDIGNFALSYDFIAGKTYYLKTRLVESYSTGDYYLCLSDNFTSFHDSYLVETIEPTCERQGYSVYFCNRCGNQYYDDYVDLLGHNFVDGCCTRCGAQKTVVDISLNETRIVKSEIPGDETIFKFTPVESGTYYFYSLTNIDTVGTVYDSNMNELCCDDDGGYNNNFKISYYFEAGTTYYLVAKPYHTDENYEITVSLSDEFERMTIMPGSGTVIDENNKLIYGIKSGLFGWYLSSHLLITGSYGFDSDSFIGTGSTLSLLTYDDDDNPIVTDTYTFVVFGDVNGDGWYDGTDAMLVNCIANGMLTREQVGEAVWTAADCNHDGVIDELDVALLNEAGLLLSQVDQTKSEEELETDSVYQEYLNLIDQNPTVEETEEPTVEPEKPAKETKTFADLFKTIFDVFINYFKSLFKITK